MAETETYLTTAEQITSQSQEKDVAYRTVPGIKDIALPLGIPIVVPGMKDVDVRRTSVGSTPYEGILIASIILIVYRILF